MIDGRGQLWQNGTATVSWDCYVSGAANLLEMGEVNQLVLILQAMKTGQLAQDPASWRAFWIFLDAETEKLRSRDCYAAC